MDTTTNSTSSISLAKKMSAMEIIFKQLTQSSNNNTSNLILGIFDRDYFTDEDIKLMADIDTLRYEKEAEFVAAAEELYDAWKLNQPTEDTEPDEE